MNGVDVNVTRYNEYVGIKIRKNLVLKHTLKNAEWNYLHEYAIILSQQHLKLFTKLLILPTLLYCNKIVIAATRTHKTKIENIQSLAIKVINNQTNIRSLPSVKNTRNKRCGIEVFKYLSGLAYTRFSGYFIKLYIVF